MLLLHIVVSYGLLDFDARTSADLDILEGHLFCHSCLMEALIAGENQGSDPGKGTPKCPVCRKKVVRPNHNVGRKFRDDVVPLAMKVRTRKRGAKGKERAVSEDWV